MKNKELKERVIAYNKAVAEKKEKASDLDKLLAGIANLPPGQLKKILTDDVRSILKKYGIEL